MAPSNCRPLATARLSQTQVLIKDSPVFRVTLMGSLSEWFSGTNNRFYSQLSDSCFVFIKKKKKKSRGLESVSVWEVTHKGALSS